MYFPDRGCVRPYATCMATPLARGQSLLNSSQSSLQRVRYLFTVSSSQVADCRSVLIPRHATSLRVHDVIGRVLGHARRLLPGDFRLPAELGARPQPMSGSGSARLYGHVVSAGRARENDQRGCSVRLSSAAGRRNTT